MYKTADELAREAELRDERRARYLEAPRERMEHHLFEALKCAAEYAERNHEGAEFAFRALRNQLLVYEHEWSQRFRKGGR